jgi:hypothetical protein
MISTAPKTYYAIKVQNQSDHDKNIDSTLFFKKFETNEEFRDVWQLCENRRRMNVLEALITPIRTDRFSNLCKDFFLPSVCQFLESTKVQNVFIKSLAFLILTPIDVISFPFRIITVIPRWIYNRAHPKESHLFYQYLIANEVAEKDLSEGYVYVATQRIEELQKTDVVFLEKHNLVTEGRTINFMQLPSNISTSTKIFNTHGINNCTTQFFELIRLKPPTITVD